jgi:hypothetical protein
MHPPPLLALCRKFEEGLPFRVGKAGGLQSLVCLFGFLRTSELKQFIFFLSLSGVQMSRKERHLKTLNEETFTWSELMKMVLL